MDENELVSIFPVAMSWKRKHCFNLAIRLEGKLNFTLLQILRRARETNVDGR